MYARVGLLERLEVEILRLPSEEASLFELHGMPGCDSAQSALGICSACTAVCVERCFTGFTLAGRGACGHFQRQRTSGDSPRMIRDCRQMNFKNPGYFGSVSILTTEGLANMAVEEKWYEGGGGGRDWWLDRDGGL